MTIKKKRSLFDHLQAVYTDQSVDYWDNLSREDQKTYSVFMINRFISMNMNFVDVVNTFQQYWGGVTDRESYLFYSQFLPKGKQWNKYISGKKGKKHEDWVIALIAKHFEVSKYEAADYVDLYMKTAEGRAALKEIFEAYGTEPRMIKKIVR